MDDTAAQFSPTPVGEAQVHESTEANRAGPRGGRQSINSSEADWVAMHNYAQANKKVTAAILPTRMANRC